MNRIPDFTRFARFVAFLADGRVIWAERNELDVDRMVIGTMRVSPAPPSP